MVNVHGAPNIRKTRFNRLQGIGTPFIGRTKSVLSGSAADITDYVTKPSGVTANTPDQEIQQCVDKLILHALPRSDAADLTGNIQLDITDGTSTKSLYFIVPSDYAVATYMNTPRSITLRPQGRIAIAPGYKVRGKVSNANILATPLISGDAITTTDARQLGLPVARDRSVTLASSSTVTLVCANDSILAETNSLAGRIIRVTSDSTATIIGQCRTIVSNTTQAGTNGKNYAANIVVDAAFSTDPSVSAVLEVMDGDFWIASTKIADATKVILAGSIPHNTGGAAKCVRVEGWCLTGSNDNTAASSANVRLYFSDRTEENTGTPATNNAARTIHRFWLPKGITAVTTPGGNNQSKGYVCDQVDDCDITGPPGYGVSVVGSSTDITSSAAIVVWGRYVNADAHYQYQPHGTSFCSAGVTTDGATQTHKPNGTGTATAGGASSLTDSGKAWLTGNMVGAYITIVAGTSAGDTRRITANTATVLTVDSAWTATPTTSSQYVISGFGGDRFWFCYDGSAVAAATTVGFFASDTAVASTTVNTPLECDIEIEGIVITGEGNGAGAQVATLLNGNVTYHTLWSLASRSDERVTFNSSGMPFRFVPICGGDPSGNPGYIQTGFGLATTGAFDSLCMTFWGRRVPPGTRATTSGLYHGNATPNIQGA